MNAAIAWFAKNGVAANLLAFTILIAGFWTARGVKREVFPEVASERISITVPYPGAAPEEVESSIVTLIEDAIEDVENIKRIRSTCDEGVGSVTAQLYPGAKEQVALDDIKAAVDQIDNFPEDAETPMVRVALMRQQVINVAVAGTVDERAIKEMARDLRESLLQDEAITQVVIANTRADEMSVEVPEATLREYGLTLERIAQAIRAGSRDIPGGSIKNDEAEWSLRVDSQARSAWELESLPIAIGADPRPRALGEIASVEDGFEQTDRYATFDGMPSALLQVFRVGDQDAIQIAKRVREIVDEESQRLPESVLITVWQDDTSYLRSRQQLLLKNGAFGLALVLFTLALFLRVSLALWVAFGILVSFVGAVWLMPSLGVSVNMLSLFAFILVLGIVVDDAIVISESIHNQQASGASPLKAAIQGCQAVARPVTFAVMTTIAAFLPLALAPGTTGQILKTIPLIVLPTLGFSLIESLFVLPYHLSHQRPPVRATRVWALSTWDRVQSRFRDFERRLSSQVYRRWLRAALMNRYLTLSCAIGAFLLALGLVGAGWVRWVFFPPVEGDNVAAFVTLPLGSPIAKTEDAVARVEAAAFQLREEVDGRREADSAESSVFRHMLASVGSQPFLLAQQRLAGRYAQDRSQSHLGEVQIELAPAEIRGSVSSEELAARWRELTGPIPGVSELRFSASVFSTGRPIELELQGEDFAALRRASDAIKGRLRTYDGVFDVSDSYRSGKKEIQIELSPAGEELGLSVGELGRQIRHAFYGVEAQRFQRNGEDTAIMVRYPESDRKRLESLNELRIRSRDGGIEAPIEEVAIIRTREGFSSIQRVDGRRSITITADVDLSKTSSAYIVSELERDFLPELLGQERGLSYTWEGERREQQETVGGLLSGYPLAMALIYALLAVPFRSYSQPLIVMSAIPFGLVGAVLGHLVMGMDLTILSVFGIVALSGVVVNDNLVLVDYINQKRAEGGALLDAVNEAGVARFRPIVLTSLTTFAGLTPLLLEPSLQAKFLAPMAISLGFGVLIASLVSLFLVPSIYMILEDWKRIPPTRG